MRMRRAATARICATMCVLFGLLASGCSASVATPSFTPLPLPTTTPEPSPKVLPRFEIKLSNGAELKGELYPDDAPKAAALFTQLANSGKLDGLPLTPAGSGEYLQLDASAAEGATAITGEYMRNGYINTVQHLRGTLTMDGSQTQGESIPRYFVCVKDAPQLDGSFDSFGRITEGMDALDLVVGDSGDQDNGQPVVITTASVDANGFPDDPTMIQEEDMKKMQYPTFTIQMADGGIMKGELYPDQAPNSVANFVALANSGFYDGLIFHRVIPGFMIQGGDPNGTGTGGPGYHIVGEFRANGIQNTLLHTKGVLSMARSQANNSAGSQFFIMVGDAPHLDGSYAAFGKVTQGIEVADRIVAAQRNANDRPMQDQRIAAIRVDTYGVEYPLNKLP